MPAWFKFELIPLVVNVSAFAYYLLLWSEPGKILYWLGASILTAGLLLMRG